MVGRDDELGRAPPRGTSRSTQRPLADRHDAVLLPLPWRTISVPRSRVDVVDARGQRAPCAGCPSSRASRGSPGRAAEGVVTSGCAQDLSASAAVSTCSAAAARAAAARARGRVPEDDVLVASHLKKARSREAGALRAEGERLAVALPVVEEPALVALQDRLRHFRRAALMPRSSHHAMKRRSARSSPVVIERVAPSSSCSPDTRCSDAAESQRLADRSPSRGERHRALFRGITSACDEDDSCSRERR